VQFFNLYAGRAAAASTADEKAMKNQTTAKHQDAFQECNSRLMTEMEKVIQVLVEVEADRRFLQRQLPQSPPQQHWITETGKTGRLANQGYSTAEYRLHTTTLT